MYFAAHEIDLNPKVKKDAYCDKGQFCSDLLIFFFFFCFLFPKAIPRKSRVFISEWVLNASSHIVEEKNAVEMLWNNK